MRHKLSPGQSLRARRVQACSRLLRRFANLAAEISWLGSQTVRPDYEEYAAALKAEYRAVRARLLRGLVEFRGAL